MTTESFNGQSDKEPRPTEPLKFPMKFSEKCPVCGWPKAVTAAVRDEQVAKGKKFPAGAPVMAERIAALVGDMTMIMSGFSTIPVITYDLDVCANPKCGAVYCVSAERKDMPATEVQKMLGIVSQGSMPRKPGGNANWKGLWP